MSTEHTDIYHCQTCGRMVYRPHGTAAPTCCCEPMVCAVADVECESQNQHAAEKSSTNAASNSAQSGPCLHKDSCQSTGWEEVKHVSRTYLCA